jgi:hypothetical protein
MSTITESYKQAELALAAYSTLYSISTSIEHQLSMATGRLTALFRV